MRFNPLVKLGQVAVVVAFACGSGSPQPPTGTPADTTAQVQLVVSGLASPVHVISPPGDSRLFITERRGTIRIVKGGQLVSTPFLDIVSKVRSGGEQGLFSVAFHPGYTTNGFFYVNYTDVNGDTRVERYQVSSNADVANAASAKLIIGMAQPASNHNGGHVLFGPDGMLYLPMGDGGSGASANGQDRTTLLGDLLRIDVDKGDPYAVPPDNPFVGQPPMRAEIWAWGLRNPWRVAFDRTAALLYIADVGQNQWEEINVVSTSQKGLNYGWNVMEGRHCLNSSTCDQSGKTLPVLEYGHSEGCSITGGIVYRGNALPGLRGHYFYSDYCSGWIKSFLYSNGQVTQQRTWNFGDLGNVSSFGEDSSGEMYIVSLNGSVYKMIK